MDDAVLLQSHIQDIACVGRKRQITVSLNDQQQHDHQYSLLCTFQKTKYIFQTVPLSLRLLKSFFRHSVIAMQHGKNGVNGPAQKTR